MKKIFSALLILSVLVQACSKSDSGSGTNSGPQITSTGFVNNHAPGNKLNNYRLDSGIIKIPSPGTSISFNYLNVPNGIPWSDTLKSPSNLIDFPGATYTIGFKDSLLGQNISLFRYYKANTTEWSLMGDDYNAFTLSISGTGTASIPKQAVKKNPVQILANFPIKYGDSSNQTCLSALNATVTTPPAPPLNLPITGPLTINQETKVNSRNICWGTLKIKGYTDSMQTVVQEYTTTIKNTYSSTNMFINALIPGILNSFGITNGQSITTKIYRFWVPNKGLVMTINADGSATVTTGL
ncbi:MAG: hypothetical protein KGZ59_07345 [Chitinophagaceae bacterium]|nr:hypothetical protein [Chitinophagaceae bacterium]